ncbi:MAG: acetyl-CoA carboxylase biotin carboxylase subunit [Planctomycetota bacterium]|nr:MAG: acetyl-CoA carboxylase biotin carboxylase subunit [Planctomycetota bacterium]
MFRRILIANRGEIALRVLRACRELGVEAVVVHSEADRAARYVALADQSICIGPPEPARSYLDIPSIISAAEVADVEAIHPGYGFLSENAHFAEVCRSCDIHFIGPPPEVIAVCGDKAKAKDIARQAGVPVVPGSDGAVESPDDAVRIAREIGYPVLLKAVSGGGGRGMRTASNEVSLLNGYHQARSEAQLAFKDPSIYMEKLVENPRHVEFQILAGPDGHCIHLGERDCSIQRRHQKLIEEAPSPALDDDLRRRMGEAAVAFARACGYRNAGTVEFLLDTHGNFYFIEINARIQVEHPVTEMVTGVDLVKWQMRIAAGQKLDLRQEDVRIRGHAIEFRINAEDPRRGFAPTPGRIERLVLPGGPGVRVDTHVHAGYVIPRYYDSMIAKLVVHGPDRASAIQTGRRALAELEVDGPGIQTTVPIHRTLLAQAEFVNSRVDTKYLERFLEQNA